MQNADFLGFFLSFVMIASLILFCERTLECTYGYDQSRKYFLTICVSPSVFPHFLASMARVATPNAPFRSLVPPASRLDEGGRAQLPALVASMAEKRAREEDGGLVRPGHVRAECSWSARLDPTTVAIRAAMSRSRRIVT